MNPAVRALSTSVALALAATTYFVLQPRAESPGPPRPSSALSAPRPMPPLAPLSAREILDRGVALDLGGEQRRRLEALDRLWRREISGLQAEIRETEREFAGFAEGTRGGRGVTAREIQRRATEFSQLSAEVRQRREHHSEAALAVLAGWQRARLTQSRPVVIGEGGHATGRN